MTAHFSNICKHGYVMSQCRCFSKDRVTHLVPCPTQGNPAHDELVRSMGYTGKHRKEES